MVLPAKISDESMLQKEEKVQTETSKESSWLRPNRSLLSTLPKLVPKTFQDFLARIPPLTTSSAVPKILQIKFHMQISNT